MSSNSTLASYTYFGNIENLIDFCLYLPNKNANKRLIKLWGCPKIINLNHNNIT
jgi:hypothetical protein